MRRTKPLHVFGGIFKIQILALEIDIIHENSGYHKISEDPLERTSPPWQLEVILEDDVPSPSTVCPQV
ncbi:hypothetical protein LEMLEM_LOCUS10102 [Lemmus lemmus]